jgi:hypothetical protein
VKTTYTTLSSTTSSQSTEKRLKSASLFRVSNMISNTLHAMSEYLQQQVEQPHQQPAPQSQLVERPSLVPCQWRQRLQQPVLVVLFHLQQQLQRPVVLEELLFLRPQRLQRPVLVVLFHLQQQLQRPVVEGLFHWQQRLLLEVQLLEPGHL